jgi:predicted choloylglycine hydrolase
MKFVNCGKKFIRVKYENKFGNTWENKKYVKWNYFRDDPGIISG